MPARRRAVAGSAAAALGLAAMLAGCGSDPPARTSMQQTRPAVAAQPAPRLQAGDVTTPIAGDGQIITRTTPKQSAAALARVAKRAQDDGDLQGAVQLYRRSLALDPEQVQVALALGQALNAMDDHRGALEAYRQVLRTDANNPEAVRGQAVALIGLDRPREAAEQFRWALARTPRDYRLHGGLGVALDLMGDHRAAQASYQTALTLQPNDSGTINNLGLSLALTGDYARATQLLGGLAESPRATARARQNLALVYGLMGQNDRAAEIARMDLDEDSVRRNLAYYAHLRARDAQPPAAVTPDTAPGAAPRLPVLPQPLAKAPVSPAGTPPPAPMPAAPEPPAPQAAAPQAKPVEPGAATAPQPTAATPAATIPVAPSPADRSAPEKPAAEKPATRASAAQPSARPAASAGETTGPATEATIGPTTEPTVGPTAGPAADAKPLELAPTRAPSILVPGGALQPKAPAAAAPTAGGLPAVTLPLAPPGQSGVRPADAAMPGKPTASAGHGLETAELPAEAALPRLPAQP
jgi:Flp pilus assembly protein TadD